MKKILNKIGNSIHNKIIGFGLKFHEFLKSGGWKFSDDHPEHIVISYTYYDWRGEYEAGKQVVPIKTLIEFSKTL